jgi:hypothetical protein
VNDLDSKRIEVEGEPLGEALMPWDAVSDVQSKHLHIIVQRPAISSRKHPVSAVADDEVKRRKLEDCTSEVGTWHYPNYLNLFMCIHLH